MRRIPDYLIWKKRTKYTGISKFQAIFRGSKVRLKFYKPHGEYYDRWMYRAKFNLAEILTALWSNYIILYPLL